jgi:hypothetical protein
MFGFTSTYKKFRNKTVKNICISLEDESESQG